MVTLARTCIQSNMYWGLFDYLQTPVPNKYKNNIRINKWMKMNRAAVRIWKVLIVTGHSGLLKAFLRIFLSNYSRILHVKLTKYHVQWQHTLSMYPTRAVGVWYLSQALKLYVTCCLSSWSTDVACLYIPGIRRSPFLEGSAFLFLPAFLNPYVVFTGFPCNSSTKSLMLYAPGTGVSC